VAAAFEPRATAESVVTAVLKLAHANNKDLYYALNTAVRVGRHMAAGDEGRFFAWWRESGARNGDEPARNWIAYNPLQFVLPLLAHCGGSADAFLRWALVPDTGGYNQWFTGGHAVPAVIGGAVLGALHGTAAFSPEVRAWAAALGRPREGRGAPREAGGRHRPRPPDGREEAGGRHQPAARQGLRQHPRRRHRQRHGLAGRGPVLLGD
jgi:hypothetical protein